MTGLNRKLLLIAQNHKNELMLSIREKNSSIYFVLQD